MKNLFVMEDGSSDEAENSEEKVAEDDGMVENEDGGAVSQQIQMEVEDSHADAGGGSGGPTGVVSSEPEDRDGQSKCSDKNKL